MECVYPVPHIPLETSFPPSTWAVSFDTLRAATNSTTDLCAARTPLEQQPQRQISTTRSVRYSAPPTTPYFLRVASAGCGLLPEHSPIAHVFFFFEAFLVNAQRAVSCCCLSVGLIVCGAKRTSCLNHFCSNFLCVENTSLHNSPITGPPSLDAPLCGTFFAVTDAMNKNKHQHLSQKSLCYSSHFSWTKDSPEIRIGPSLLQVRLVIVPVMCTKHQN